MNDEASEYDRMTTEFNESNEEDGDNEYDGDRESDEEVIIDKPFSNEQMPQTLVNSHYTSRI